MSLRSIQSWHTVKLHGNVVEADEWFNLAPGFWTTEVTANFNLSWTGEYTLITLVTSTTGLNNGEWESNGYLKSTQVSSKNPVVLTPFKQYTISHLSASTAYFLTAHLLGGLLERDLIPSHLILNMTQIA